MTRPVRPSRHAWIPAFAAACGALAVAPVSTRAADPAVSAAWHDATVVVDGSIADWPHLDPISGGPAVAAQNDSRDLYLAVASKDPVVRQQLATGLIVWIDGTGQRAERFGVRLEGLAPRPLQGATPTASATDLLAGAATRNVLDEFDLLGPAKGQRRLIEHPDAAGIAAASGVEDGTMLYEIKVPLAQTSATPYAAGAKPGATIALGLETPTDPKQPHRREKLADPTTTTMPLGMDPYGGYFNPPPRHDAGGSSDSQKDATIKPMKLVWCTVTLATADAHK